MRVNPPIREPGHAEALWEGLHDGTIDMIATDHAPHQPEEKDSKNIWECDCGFPGVETQMPIMLTQVNLGRLSLQQYVKWSAHAPAHAWGCYPNKGVIQAGSDADIAIVDMGSGSMIDREMLHSKSKMTVWHGFQTSASVEWTLVRGAVVVEKGVLVGKQGHGKPVQQKMPTPAPRNQDKSMEEIVKIRF